MAVGKNLPTIAIGGGSVYDNFIMGQDQSFWVGFATVSVPISGWWGGTKPASESGLLFCRYNYYE